MKYCIVTFGCRTNQADSLDIDRELRTRGGDAAPLAQADLVVVNTCSVTATAEQSARQAIRRARRLNPAARIQVTGCYATRAPEEIAALGCSGCVAPVAPHEGRIEFGPAASGTCPAPAPLSTPGTHGRTIYLMRVQTGCDESCTYCVVPSTRGPGRSVPLEDVLDRLAEVEEAGFRELTLTGVHLGSYGRDLVPPSTLSRLVTALEGHRSSLRFRLSAIEPMDVNDALLGALGRSTRFAHHFHLPLQHASDTMLRAMGRPYTLAEYDERICRLSNAFPDAALGADLLVGFPGETEADFERCAEYVRSSPLTYLHVFPYSPRPGTVAASLGPATHSRDVRRRVARLRAIGADRTADFRRRFVGSTLGGLTIEDGSLVLTDNYLRVRIRAGLPRNQRVSVKIRAEGNPMRGEVLGRELTILSPVRTEP